MKKVKVDLKKLIQSNKGETLRRLIQPNEKAEEAMEELFGCDTCYTCQACFTAQEAVPKEIPEDGLRRIPERSITKDGRECECCYVCQACNTCEAGQTSLDRLDRYGYSQDKGLFKKFWASLWARIRHYLFFGWLKIKWR